jgi:hypothetical protein
VGALHPVSTMHYKAVLALCNVLTCSGMNDLSRLLPERKKVQWCGLLRHTTPHVSLWHVPLSLKWLTTSNSAVTSVHDTIQTEYFLFRKNTVSRKISISSQMLFQESRPAGFMCCCSSNLHARKRKRLCTTSWTVEWGICSCLLVRVDLSEIRSNACLMCSTSSRNVCGRPGNFWFTSLPVLSQMSPPLHNGVVAWCWISTH